MAIVTGVFVLYFALLVFLLAGWNRAMRQREEPPLRKRPLISIVVPVRNEEMRMWTLLENLSLQDYTPFEIIVVDDDSQDETLWVARQSDLKNLRILQSKGRGKKEALTCGIRAAKGTIIATTDADCLFPPQWLSHVCAEFQDPKVMM
ncbi:MAG TPA: glycosyltransferase, partial [Chryseosolibacter sp.]